MKNVLNLAKTAALLSALALAASAALPGIAMASLEKNTTTVTCRGAGDSCPIELNGNPVALALESVVVSDK